MGGDNDMNPESEVNTQGREYVPDTKAGIETDEKASTFEISEAAIDQATEKVKQENNPIIEMDKVKGLFNSEVRFMEFKVHEFSQNAKEFFKNMTWSKAARFGSTVALGFVLASCAGKTAEASAPVNIEPVGIPSTQVLPNEETLEVANNDAQTQEVEDNLEASMEAPEEKEQPPEVDLGWHNWMIFKDFFGGSSTPLTEEIMQEHFDPVDEDKAIYMFIARNSYIHDEMTIPYETVTPEYNPGWNYVETINGDEVGMSLDLNDVEKEILEQFILFRKDQGSKLRLFLFIGDKQEGREIRDFFDKEGAFVLIEDAEVLEDSEDGKDFKVTIYEQEDIPWDIIPEEVWDDIANGNVMLDLRKGKVNCFANVNDIRGGVTPR